MNDKRRKRFIIAIILGVISLGITSLSFSYAWYVSSTRVEISGVDITIRSERNLVISPTKDGEYRNKIGYEHLDESGMYDPCSSMYCSEWIAEKKESPEFYRYDMPFVDGTGKPRHSLATSGLFSQELYLQVDDDAYITLDKEMLKLESDESKNKAHAERISAQYPDYTVDELVERLNSLKKCMRISILVPDQDNYKFYIIDPYKEGETYYGGREDLEKTGYYSYYVRDEELYETVFGEVKNRDKIVYDEKRTTDSELIGEATSFNAKSKAGVRPFNYEKSVANGMEIVTENSLTVEEVEDKVVIPMYNNTPKRIVVSFYMEGWDLDCTNVHMGGSFNVELGFKILREM